MRQHVALACLLLPMFAVRSGAHADSATPPAPNIALVVFSAAPLTIGFCPSA